MSKRNLTTELSPPAKRAHGMDQTFALSDILTPTPANSLGALLSLVDLVCGRCAHHFSNGRVVTGTFDDVRLYRAVAVGDIAYAEAQVIGTGNSTLLIRFVVKVEQVKIMDGLTTFVAVDDNGIRRLERHANEAVGDTDGAELMKRLKTERKMFNGMQFGDGENLRIRKQFLPRNLNGADAVFGGDLLDLFDGTARAVGKGKTVQIRGLGFLKPVRLQNVLEVEGRIVTKAGRFVTVLVTSWIEGIVAHRGLFHLVTEEDGGGERKDVGLALCRGVAEAWSAPGEQKIEMYHVEDGLDYF